MKFALLRRWIHANKTSWASLSFSRRGTLKQTYLTEIHELMARYNHAIDFGDTDAWVETFTEDGVFHGGMGRFEGKTELLNFAQGFVREFPDGRHWINNIVIEFDGNTARSTCYLHFFRASDGLKTQATGRYNDRLRMVDGHWRFVERVVLLD